VKNGIFLYTKLHLKSLALLHYPYFHAHPLDIMSLAFRAKLARAQQKAAEHASTPPQIEEPTSPQVTGSSPKSRVGFAFINERTFAKGTPDVPENRSDSPPASMQSGTSSEPSTIEWCQYLDSHPYLISSPVSRLLVYHDQAIADNDTVAVTVIRCIIDTKRSS
jgi:hypothetical protein